MAFTDTVVEHIEMGPRLSQATVAGGLVFLTGQVSELAEGGSVTDQTSDVLAKIDRLLDLAGTDKSKLVTATVYLTDLSKFPEMNAAWDKWVDPKATPSRTTVRAELLAKRYAVEITVVAATSK